MVFTHKKIVQQRMDCPKRFNILTQETRVKFKWRLPNLVWLPTHGTQKLPYLVIAWQLLE